MKKKWIIVIILALTLRLLLVNLAYHGDMNNNISWGDLAVERGLSGYFEGSIWPYSAPNQPPLTIILFSFLSWLWLSINKIFWILNDGVGIFPSKLIWFWELKGKVLLYKLPSILADFGIAYVIFIWVKKITKDIKKSFLPAFIWLFNPIVFYNSAIWGQTDSIVNLLGLLSIYFLSQKKLTQSLLFLTLSLLFKGSLAFFIPVFLALVYFQKYELKSLAKSTLIALLTVIVVGLPFHLRPDILFWFADLYTNRIFPGEIGYLTANAFNFWWLVDSGKTYDSISYLGQPARIWGFVLTFIFIILSLFGSLKKLMGENILLIFATISLIVFLFMTRIHERYMYPFFPYATVAYFIYPKIRPVYLILSVTFIINMYNLFWFPPIPVLENALLTTNLPVFLSFINLLSFLYLISIIKHHKV